MQSVVIRVLASETRNAKAKERWLIYDNATFRRPSLGVNLSSLERIERPWARKFYHWNVLDDLWWKNCVVGTYRVTLIGEILLLECIEWPSTGELYRWNVSDDFQRGNRIAGKYRMTLNGTIRNAETSRTILCGNIFIIGTHRTNLKIRRERAPPWYYFKRLVLLSSFNYYSFDNFIHDRVKSGTNFGSFVVINFASFFRTSDTVDSPWLFRKRKKLDKKLEEKLRQMKSYYSRDGVSKVFRFASPLQGWP